MAHHYPFQYQGGQVDIYEPVVIVRPEMIRLGAGVRIDSFVKLEGGEGLDIGRWVHVASFAHLNIGGGELLVGDGAAFASGSKVITGSNLPEGRSMSASAPMAFQRIERKRNIIGAYACVLTNAVVLPGLNIGEGGVLAAGAVLTKDLPNYEIWAGVPARKIGVRRIGEQILSKKG